MRVESFDSGPLPLATDSAAVRTLVLRNRAFSPSIFTGLLVVFDGLTIFSTGVLVFLMYLGWGDVSLHLYVTAAAVQTICVTASFYMAGLYRFDSLSHPLKTLRTIVVNTLGIFVGLLTLAFMLKISDNFSRVWAFSWLSTMIILLGLGRVVFYSFMLSWSRAGKMTRNIAVVGGDEQARRLLQHINQNNEPWNRVLGIFDDRLSRSGESLLDYPVLGSLDNLIEYARKHRVDDVIVTLPWSADRRLHDIINKLRELPVNIHLGSDLAGYMYPKVSYTSIGGIPILSVAHKPKPIKGWNVILKTLEDKILAGIALVLTSPLLALTALAIKLDSPGPILFRQPRYGFNNTIFYVYKFRTMNHNQAQNKDAKAQQATRDDPRVTRIGRFLRRSSIDELPQLFNVLQGKMSLVGPRPHPVAMNVQYAASINNYMMRHRVRPGITGWAQVCGLRGETEVPEKMQARVEHDIHYIENWSMRFDIRILFLTLFVGFFNKNAY